MSAVRSAARGPRGDAPLLTPLVVSGLLALLYETCFFVGRPRGAFELAYFQVFVVAQWLSLTLLVALAARLAHAALRSWMAHLVAGFLFTVPLLLYVDLVVVQRVNRHLGSIVVASFDMSFRGSRELVEAAGVGGARFAGAIVVLGLVFAAGVGLDVLATGWGRRFTARVLPRLSRVTLRVECIFLASAVLLVNALGAGCSLVVQQAAWQRFHRAMPILTNVVGPVAHARSSMKLRLRPLRTEAQIEEGLAKLVLPKTPSAGDIVIFAADSLRADAIDAATSPAIDAFGRTALHFDRSVSGGNATHVGLYAFFRADPALTWTPELAGGPAVPLRIARKLGYRIEVLAAASLGYLGIDRQIFGPSLELADSFTDERDLAAMELPKRDAHLTDELVRRLAAPHPPTVFFLFLNSTHLPYLWADDFEPPFRPYAGLSDSFKLQTGGGQEGVRTRYRDSVAYIDTLFRRVQNAIHAGGHEDETSLLVTGDHGEEFWEHGLAGHASELCGPQTRVPLFLRLPRGTLAMEPDHLTGAPLERKFGTLEDVWPTLLEVAGVRGPTAGLFDGVSMLHASRRALLTTSLSLWGGSPAQLALEDEELKIVFELEDPNHRFTAQEVDIVDVFDSSDNPIHTDLTASQYSELARRHFGPELSQLFEIIRW